VLRRFTPTSDEGEYGLIVQLFRASGASSIDSTIETLRPRRGIAAVAADFLLNLIAYNLIRIPKLVAA
jgi:hypothetical protein